MADEINSELTRLFAATNEVLPPRQFVTDVSQRIQGARRMRSLWRVVAWAAAFSAAAAASPVLIRLSLELASYSDVGTQRLADLLVSPWGIAGSLLVAFVMFMRIRARLR